MKSIAMILVVMGMVLFGVGMSMRTKQNTITRIETTVEKGSRNKAVAVGATTGAVVGGSAGATVGGIGIVACGTGVGIPAGIVCLAAAGICALVGGGVGYAVGKPTITTATPAIEVVHAYSPLEYWTVIVVGCLLMSLGMFLAIRRVRCTGNSEAISN